ncbi:sarcosine oxidase subunit gamma [Spinactinospora alkalitolerans]|uniref:Sarcosine oxidase subunit gamma n=1 Tax=Spinactinospora alkalitolerans TaxID=687207 RepID=A0A852TR93_9ACTN|nr:sarcosine oxidase subunit gamma family protein [Spinactinospora alkalitolerans]NYE45352.1 sarcosine oxidase subunit gamma [Spinactinospora alkalitolerans]
MAEPMRARAAAAGETGGAEDTGGAGARTRTGPPAGDAAQSTPVPGETGPAGSPNGDTPLSAPFPGESAPVTPLAGHAARFAGLGAATGSALRVAEQPVRTQLTVRADPGGPAAAAIGRVLGSALPTAATTAVRTGDRRVLWLGPDEWLVTAPLEQRLRLEADLRAAADGLADDWACVVDASGQHAVLSIAGPLARDLLAKGCAIDLHPRAFGPGRCARTWLARAQAVILNDAENAGDEPAYTVLVRSSYARYLADWLLDASAEWKRRS